jgi:HAD superfamily hydrolase (TIGR01509 family)
MIRALVFDFDGLILDTESPVMHSWQETYREHGVELPLDIWRETIGTADHDFDPMAHLEGLLGRDLDHRAITEKRKVVRDTILHAQEVLPGVREYIDAAGRLGLMRAVASSSSREWVVGHLERLGLYARWDSVLCSDNVSLTKPDPELYLASVEALGIAPREALALEDSHNGLLAAKRAGLYCACVPGPLTLGSDFSLADVVLGSLSEVPLPELLHRLPPRPLRLG